MIDVSVYKLAEKALNKSDDHLHEFMDALPQMTWISNSGGKILYFNKAWYEYTGMHPGQTDGWVKVVHPEDSAQVIEAWRQALVSGQYHIEYRIRNHIDKAYRYFLEQAEPFRDANGNILFWFGTFTETDDNFNSAP
ncbi:PAS domain-containing protein [Pontibacter sp. KCTC 32443]|uniref:PAS domain-containing protein n=1 Tax=Pontibacter TaxID=323449 RepID=UPI00164D00D6|nr:MULTISPECIES: PAS domain-containing protein [Pontibacter]MBC5774268.1 PAS domain-containing protein [Pontibacter sp. KCTC 32443]